MPDALRRFADDLDDPGADLIIAALIINSRLRGPGLRDLLGGLSTSVREELDMRRKINADRRSTRRSVQIVVLVAVAVALLLGVFNHSYVSIYDQPLGQIVLIVVAGFYAAGFFWLRKLARFDAPERLLAEPLVARRGRQRAGDRRRLAGRRLMTAAIIAGAIAGGRDLPADRRAAATPGQPRAAAGRLRRPPGGRRRRPGGSPARRKASSPGGWASGWPRSAGSRAGSSPACATIWPWPRSPSRTSSPPARCWASSAS